MWTTAKFNSTFCAPADGNAGTIHLAHAEIGSAERCERICNGVGDGGEGGEGAGFAAAFDAERVGRAAGAVEADIEQWQVVGAGIA
jgi:hypothetical protein